MCTNCFETPAWPSGKASLIVAELFHRYRPQDTMTRVELRMQLNNVMMGAGSTNVLMILYGSFVKTCKNYGM